jgi:hypothetical protein
LSKNVLNNKPKNNLDKTLKKYKVVKSNYLIMSLSKKLSMVATGLGLSACIGSISSDPTETEASEPTVVHTHQQLQESPITTTVSNLSTNILQRVIVAGCDYEENRYTFEPLELKGGDNHGRLIVGAPRIYTLQESHSGISIDPNPILEPDYYNNLDEYFNRLTWQLHNRRDARTQPFSRQYLLNLEEYGNTAILVAGQPHSYVGVFRNFRPNNVNLLESDMLPYPTVVLALSDSNLFTLNQQPDNQVLGRLTFNDQIDPIYQPLYTVPSNETISDCTGVTFSSNLRTSPTVETVLCSVNTTEDRTTEMFILDPSTESVLRISLLDFLEKHWDSTYDPENFNNLQNADEFLLRASYKINAPEETRLEDTTLINTMTNCFIELCPPDSIFDQNNGTCSSTALEPTPDAGLPLEDTESDLPDHQIISGPSTTSISPLPPATILPYSEQSSDTSQDINSNGIGIEPGCASTPSKSNNKLPTLIIALIGLVRRKRK